jgi:hypothetical protein
MIELTQIREALKSVLTQVTPANGYVKTIAASRFYDLFDGNAVSRQNDDKFPKFFIGTESGKLEKLASRRVLHHVSFLIIVVVKTVPSVAATAREQIEDYIDDIDKVIQANDTLQDTVHDATVSEYQTDSGNLHPEGAAVIRVDCTYYKQF